jgi:hypothetical protein
MGVAVQINSLFDIPDTSWDNNSWCSVRGTVQAGDGELGNEEGKRIGDV